MIYVVHFQKQHHPLEIARHPGASIAKTFFLSPKRSNMGKAGSAGLAIPVTVGAETTIHHGTATALSRRGQLSLRTVWQASVVLPESLSPSTRLDRFKIQMMSLFISNFKIFSFSFMIMFELEVLFLMLECAYLSPTFSFIWLVGTWDFNLNSDKCRWSWTTTETRTPKSHSCQRTGVAWCCCCCQFCFFLTRLRCVRVRS